jgi:hypothetical protein
MTPRCTHTAPSGRRCRSSSSPGSSFCPTHQPKQDPAAGLVRDLDQFRSAADVTVFLSRLIGAVSRGEISTRRAAVLSYVAISLMHALRQLQREKDAGSDGSTFDPLPISWAVPDYGYPGFVNEDDARAFYAQRYADNMREVAEESLAKPARSPSMSRTFPRPANRAPASGISHAHDRRPKCANVICP